MKGLNIYRIKELALKSKKAVYSIQQLANLIGKPKAIATVYAGRLVRAGLAKRLLRGKISFADDDYVIASQLIEPAYVSLTSALLFHGLITQVPANVECVTPKNSRNYTKLRINYHKLPPSLFFGYGKYEKSGSYIFVAEPEKALLDAVYLNIMPKNMVKEIKSKCDSNKLASYVGRFTGRGKKKLEEWLL